jgi:archaeal flagellar protein FlaI
MGADSSDSGVSVTNELVDFVKKSLKEGASIEKIRRKLLKKGWEADAVDLAINQTETGSTIKQPSFKEEKEIKTYDITSKDIPLVVRIVKAKGEYVPIYEVSLSSIGPSTQIILENIRKDLISKVNLGMVDITDPKKSSYVEDKFFDATQLLIKKYFPAADDFTIKYLTSYMVQKSLGMGDIELLMADAQLEEIAINSSEEPVWVFHREFGWLKTNIVMNSEAQTRHYAAMIGRKVDRQISSLEPLMDAHLDGGDRVNATLMPVSTKGNTITLRKFAAKPWTMTDFIRTNTLSASASALIWQGIQFELSTLIAGGTASGKTSMLNAIGNFFPPNQRILSIEDTREIQLPKFLHWIPMVTKFANTEGRGEVTMLDLLVNSLRQRPDRILVGEIRRKKEAEVLFEAIHTGHSVYATVHANSTQETITRLTSPPIEVPKSMLPALSLIIVQFRNRRTGTRRTFELSEIKENGDPNILMKYDIKKDILQNKNKSSTILKTLEMYAGFTEQEVKGQLTEKETILKWLVKQNVNMVDDVGRVMAEYYTDKENLLKTVKKNKKFEG